MNFDFEPPTPDSATLLAFKLLMADKRKAAEDMVLGLPNQYEYLKEQVYSESLQKRRASVRGVP